MHIKISISVLVYPVSQFRDMIIVTAPEIYLIRMVFNHNFESHFLICA